MTWSIHHVGLLTGYTSDSPKRLSGENLLIGHRDLQERMDR